MELGCDLIAPLLVDGEVAFLAYCRDAVHCFLGFPAVYESVAHVLNLLFCFAHLATTAFTGTASSRISNRHFSACVDSLTLLCHRSDIRPRILSRSASFKRLPLSSFRFRSLFCRCSGWPLLSPTSSRCAVLPSRPSAFTLPGFVSMQLFYFLSNF